MIAKNITRRLERLEEATAPAGESKVWQIVTIDSDGNREHGPIPALAPRRFSSQPGSTQESWTIIRIIWWVLSVW